MNQITINWKGKMAFEADCPSGTTLRMDSYPESGGENSGPTPVESLIAGIAGCSAMDVISILQKKRQEVTGYRIEVEWERGPEGVYPRPVTGVKIKHIVSGVNLDPAAVERSIELSEDKYCTVIATVRSGTKVESSWSIEEA